MYRKKEIKRKQIKIFVDKDGIINFVDQTRNTVEDALVAKEKILELAKKMPKPRRLLTDLTGIETPSAKIRKIVAEMMKEARIDKIALVGGDFIMKTVANFMMSASGIKNSKFFKTKKEAIEWLKQK